MKTINYAGGWAEVKDPSEVLVKHRRMLRAKMTAASAPMNRLAQARDQWIASLNLNEGQEPPEGFDYAKDVDLTEEESDHLLILEQASLVATIGRWSGGDVTMDVLDNLTAGVYDPLAAACKKAAEAVLRNEEVDFEPTPEMTENPTGA